jgi:peroxiredoxin family protein
VSSQQPKGQLQTQHSLYTGKHSLHTGKTKIKGKHWLKKKKKEEEEKKKKKKKKKEEEEEEEKKKKKKKKKKKIINCLNSVKIFSQSDKAKYPYLQ